MKRIFAVVLLAGLSVPASLSWATEPSPAPTETVVEEKTATPEEVAARQAIDKLLKSLQPVKGEVALDDFAKIALPQGVCYLNARDAKTVIEDLWGNPPNVTEGVYGMIVKSPEALLDDNAWGIIISYTKDGHVDDSDAAKIDYTELLATMKKGTAESNKERKKLGYDTVDLVGWAEQPHYDPATHKIYWAKELRFEGVTDHTLNYCVRILGRRGVLELNTVAPLSTLEEVRVNSRMIQDGIDFTPGHRYADFNRATDDMASYGIAALVAGGVAKKVGLFKLLLAFAMAAKKFLVVGVVALGAFVSRLFKRKE